MNAGTLTRRQRRCGPEGGEDADELHQEEEDQGWQVRHTRAGQVVTDLAGSESEMRREVS